MDQINKDNNRKRNDDNQQNNEPLSDKEIAELLFGNDPKVENPPNIKKPIEILSQQEIDDTCRIRGDNFIIIDKDVSDK